MRKFISAALILSAVAVCASVPNKITYQGRLFKSGVAIEGMHTFRVRILRQNGTPTSYSTVASVNLPASGEFTIVLDNVTGVDWLADNPKLEIAVDGETLSPNEDFTTTAFSFVAKQVDAGGVDTDAIQNGAVTNVKISTVSATKVMLSNSNVAIASWESGNTGMIDSTKISGSIISAPSAHAITHGNTGSDRVSLDRGQTGGIAIVSTATFVQKIETFNNSTDTFRIYGTAGAQQDAFYPLRVYGTQTPQEEQFNVRGDGQTYVKGNLGVGTTNPSAKLEVKGRIKDNTGFLMPVGSIVAFGGSTAPAGWLLCDGTTYTIASRPELDELRLVLGSTYGGNGTSTFSVPDLRGRSAIGAGTGTGLTNRPMGQTLGEEAHALTIPEIPGHTHGVTDPGHQHDIHVWNPVGAVGGNYISLWATNGDRGFQQEPVQTAKTGISIQSTGGGQSHNNMQPSLVINYIVKY